MLNSIVHRLFFGRRPVTSVPRTARERAECAPTSRASRSVPEYHEVFVVHHTPYACKVPIRHIALAPLLAVFAFLGVLPVHFAFASVALYSNDVAQASNVYNGANDLAYGFEYVATATARYVETVTARYCTTSLSPSAVLVARNVTTGARATSSAVSLPTCTNSNGFTPESASTSLSTFVFGSQVAVGLNQNVVFYLASYNGVQKEWVNNGASATKNDVRTVYIYANGTIQHNSGNYHIGTITGTLVPSVAQGGTDRTLRITAPADMSSASTTSTTVHFSWTSSIAPMTVYVCEYVPGSATTYTKTTCASGGTGIVTTASSGSASYTVEATSSTPLVVHVYRGPPSLDSLPGQIRYVDWDEVRIGVHGASATTSTAMSASSLFPTSQVKDVCEGLDMSATKPWNYLVCAGLTLFVPTGFVATDRVGILGTKFPFVYWTQFQSSLDGIENQAHQTVTVSLPNRFNGASTTIPLFTGGVAPSYFPDVWPLIRQITVYVFWLALPAYVWRRRHSML